MEELIYLWLLGKEQLAFQAFVWRKNAIYIAFSFVFFDETQATCFMQWVCGAEYSLIP